MPHLKAIVFIIFYCMCVNHIFSQQPIMDTLPRWDKGYGFQFRYIMEYNNNIVQDDNLFYRNHSHYTNHHQWLLEASIAIVREFRINFHLPVRYSLFSIRKQDYQNYIDNTQTDSYFLLENFYFDIIGKGYFQKKGIAGSSGGGLTIFLPTSFTHQLENFIPAPFGIGFSAFIDVETYYILFILHSALNVYIPYTNSYNKNNNWTTDINLGYHVWYDSIKNMGIWLLFSSKLEYIMLKETTNKIVLDRGNSGFTLSIGASMRFYKDNFLWNITILAPVAYHNSIGIQNSVLVSTAFGIAFSYSD